MKEKKTKERKKKKNIHTKQKKLTETQGSKDEYRSYYLKEL